MAITGKQAPMQEAERLPVKTLWMDLNKDLVAPALSKAVATNSLNVLVTFDEPVDSTKAAVVSNYSISDGINQPISAVPVGPVFKEVMLTLSIPVTPGKIYTLTVKDITDCSGNPINAMNTTRLGLASID